MKKKDALIAALKKLGARDPESWAESEIEEDIPQLARFTFLKGAWDQIVRDGDASWIDGEIASTPEGSAEPYAGVAHALRKLKREGADLVAVADVVRGMQARLLFDLCYMLSDPDSVAGNDSVGWSLVESDENEGSARVIDGLHESVLETDPTGREMRPRNRG